MYALKAKPMTEQQDLDTPALVIDEAIALANINAFQAHCNKLGLKLRPHIKTHKTIHFARHQLNAGACGITCQKISEAEIMANGGINDILITFNIVGASKLNRLVSLSRRIKSLAVTADNSTVVRGLSGAFADESNPLDVLIECDTGAGRCGVQSPEQVLSLALAISSSPGLNFGGLMTYPTPKGADDAAHFMRRSVSLLAENKIECPVVSTGGTPEMWSAGTRSVFTEYRIGTYIYNDRSLIELGVATEENCAARVHATVVSRPTVERAIIDAGSKVLTSDVMGFFSDYGRVVGHRDAVIESLSEEHGVLRVEPDSALMPGDRIQVIPNHVCVVCNMFGRAWLCESSGQLQPLMIDARGMVL